ncbi:MAG: L,D-transpeptidase family protein [Fimbriimonadaceae bacterium]|nr:L,D-transpeptidase family protein [Fimbriimonadaceae bacterium]
MRAIKSEDVLELWGAKPDEPYQLVKAFTIARQSGKPGPKRKEGDRQVPEGCYRIAVFNPESQFHLSLGLNYPNESDLVRSDRAEPGSDIYIHGSNVSIGCLAMTDPIIEQIYSMAENAKKSGQDEIRVDIFPARPGTPEWNRLFEEYPEHTSFWREIEPAYRQFEISRFPAKFTIGIDGAYHFAK